MALCKTSRRVRNLKFSGKLLERVPAEGERPVHEIFKALWGSP